jgi:hypothetical protein
VNVTSLGALSLSLHLALHKFGVLALVVRTAAMLTLLLLSHFLTIALPGFILHIRQEQLLEPTRLPSRPGNHCQLTAYTGIRLRTIFP